MTVETIQLANTTAIEWTKTTLLLPDGTRICLPGFTYNGWWGCEHQGEPGMSACDACYAEILDKNPRFNPTGETHWGRDRPRRFFPDTHFDKLLAHNRKAQELEKKYGVPVRLKVFMFSMGDIAEWLPETHVSWQQMQAVRARIVEMVPNLTHLHLIWLTKRPQNLARIVPKAWMDHGWPENVWPGVTLEHARYGWRVGKLCQIPARHRFLSMEPLLGPVDLLHLPTVWQGKKAPANAFDLGITWVLAGGESGSFERVRPIHLDWVRAIRDACMLHEIPFHFKQHGNLLVSDTAPGTKGKWAHRDGRTRLSAPDIREDGWQFNAYIYDKHKAGRLLDGRTWDEEPVVATYTGKLDL